mgnify:CR=1 FL=1
MEQAYQYLLALEFRHKYFQDSQFKSIQVSFDEVTTRLIKNLGIILKPYPGGLHMFTSDIKLLNDATLNTPIRLYLTCNDPYYINYSKLPGYRPSDTVLYFNNLSPSQNSENIALSLHGKKHVGKIAVYKFSSGKVILDTFKEGNTYRFEDAIGNDISDSIHIKQIEEDGFLISNQYEGNIQVIGEDEENEKVYANPKPVWKKPLAIVELYIPNLFEAFDSNKKQVYALKFETVKTKWKYYFVSPVYKNLQNPSIINSKKERVFESIMDRPDDVEAYHAFISIDEHPLLEHSEDFFSLINDENSLPIIKALPRASPENLVYDDDKKTMYSHIYL